MSASPQTHGSTLMQDELKKSVCKFYVGRANPTAFCGPSAKRVYAKRTNPHCHSYFKIIKTN